MRSWFQSLVVLAPAAVPVCCGLASFRLLGSRQSSVRVVVAPEYDRHSLPWLSPPRIPWVPWVRKWTGEGVFDEAQDLDETKASHCTGGGSIASQRSG